METSAFLFFVMHENFVQADPLNSLKIFTVDMTFRAKRGDADLERRIRRDLAFLFQEHGATVSANMLEGYGSSEVTVAVGNLEFQFVKNDRDGDFRVAVAPRSGHGVWERLQVALAASTGEEAATLNTPISYHDDPVTLSYTGLTYLAEVLKIRFERLNSAFSPENYPATHSRMIQIERSIHPK